MWIYELAFNIGDDEEVQTAVLECSSTQELIKVFIAFVDTIDAMTGQELRLISMSVVGFVVFRGNLDDRRN